VMATLGTLGYRRASLLVQIAMTLDVWIPFST
jgi:hypothetical protein